MTTAIASDPFAAVNASAAKAVQTKNDAGSADRFLKLLVTQMQNQDPLNPMDNAQVTTQMAQINTVSGVEKLNDTVDGLNGQFMQLQALQGAALVGHDISLKGNRVAIEDGKGVGSFDLAGKADKVKLEVISATGKVLETMDLGVLAAGRHDFEWAAGANTDDSKPTFRVTATLGSTSVTSTTFMRDRVESVSSSSSGLVLQTQRSGNVAYADVKAFN